jgi:alkaline phosphatase D
MLGSPAVSSRRPAYTLAAVASIALALAPAAAGTPKGFKYGVTAGDVSSSSAILWAKANKSGKVLAQIAARGGFGACKPDNAVAKMKAKSGHDNTVSAAVDGLRADTSYKYRFCTVRGGRSATGKFTTAPDPRSKQTIRFGFSGDQDARPVPGGTTPYWNNFEIWDAIRQQRNDFNVLMGDTIYSDTEVPGYTLADVALTKQQKWRAYKINLGMKPWTKARGSAAYYAHWDDHEFINNFAVGENSFPLGVGTVNADGEQLYKASRKAFIDYNPATYSKQSGLYRSVRWGKNLEVFFLDERSFRSNLADYSGVCDNPPGSGDRDLAPTAPQSTRDLFSVIVPQLGNPVPPGCLEAINDPSRTMLGSRQLKNFKREIASSKATFKVIMNELPIQQYYADPYDRWEGYAAERQALLHYLQDKVDNVVFLTADVHASMVNDARFNTLGDGGVQNSGILDVTTGPIATANYSLEISDTAGNPSAGALVQSAFLKPQPPNGVGMQCASTDQFSYAEVAVSKSRLSIDLLDADDNPVLDTGDTSTPGAPPCAQIVIPKQ